jgi:spore germination protein YaaH
LQADTLRFVRCVIALSFVLGCAVAAPKPPITTLIYLVNSPASIASFRAHADRVSIIAPQTFYMDAQGFIQGEVPRDVLQIAAEHHVAVTPLVVNRGFNQPLMHTVLDSEESRARAIRYLIYYALRDGYQGFQFDYENILYTYRDKFTQFFHEAAREFHRHGLQLSAAIVGRRDDVRKGNNSGYDNWSGVYDYIEIAKVADFISVMAYAEHGPSANPGPVAGLPWVTAIAKYSADTMGAEKVSLGVPLYGVRWDATDPNTTPAPARKWRGRSSRYSDTSKVLAAAEAQWDDTQSSPHVSFETVGRPSVLWFENARSLQTKLQLTHDMGFIGISAWAAGQEDPAFWDSLDTWRIRHPRRELKTGPLDARSKRAARELARAHR